VSDFLPRSSEAFLSWAIPLAWQIALLVAGILVLDRGLARAPACVRHGLWMLVAVRALVPPSIGSPLGLLPGPASAVRGAARGAEVPNVAAVPSWPVLLWAFGVAVAICVPWARSRRRLAQWRREATAPPHALIGSLARAAAKAGLRRPPSLLLSSTVGDALVCGLARPLLVLPERLSRAAAETLDHVLLHECAHVKRRDLWAEALFAVASVLFWWHPLVGFARRRARDAREMACDASVVARLGEAASYRVTLIRMALAHGGAAPVAGGAAFLPRPHAVVARARALERATPRIASWARVVAVVLPTVVGAALSARPGPPTTHDDLADERGAARAHLAALLSAPGRPGCLPLRFAVMRCVAAGERAPLAP
jgi:beta-lactamase regulating signal transducer with metallopeptidase domain